MASPNDRDRDLPAALDANKVRLDLAARSREPFEHALARLLSAQPTEEDWRTLAIKYPDKWAQALAILTRAAGYTERTEVTHNVGLIGFARQVEAMADSDLFSQFAPQLLELPTPPKEEPK